MTQVFISHSSQNDEFVTWLASELQTQGVAGWIDHQAIQPGQDWDAEVQTALEASEVMIVVLSQAAVESQNVRVEWSFFLDLGKPIYPVLFEKCQVPFRLRLLQQVDFTRDRDDGLGLLLRALQQQARVPGARTVVDVPEDARSITPGSARRIEARLVLSGHRDSARGVAFSPDGQMLASAAEDKNVRLWYTTRKRQIKMMIGHERPVQRVAFRPDGAVLASASDDRTIRLWNVAKRYGITALMGHTGPVLAVAYSPDGKLLASSSEDGTVRLWDNKRLREVRALEGHAGPVYDVAFSPNGELLLSAGADRCVRLWEIDEGCEVSAIEINDAVRRMAFSPDGRLLALGLESNGLAVVDTTTQQTLGNIYYADFNTNCVRGVAFSPDGALVAVGSLDGDIRLFKTDALTRKPPQKRALRVLRGHEGGICDLAFSPDGKLLASVSHDKTARLWGVTK